MIASVRVEPAFCHVPAHSRSLGPEVADLARLAGLPPDPEQELSLDALFAMDVHGRCAAFEFCLICCRQNMKTALFKMAALGWLYITDQQLVVWSAHEFRTAQEAFRDMELLVTGSDALRSRVKKIHYGNGDEAIELHTGQRLIFKARTKGGGRGLSGDKVVLDEGFALKPEHMGALLPTLSARPDPQVVVGSSAGLMESEVLRGMRDRGRAGTSDRQAYLEWGAEDVGCADGGCDHHVGAEGCALDDQDAWKRANPALGRRITVEYIRAERQALPAGEFARERLGWWDDPGDSTFDLDAWHALGWHPPEDDPLRMPPQIVSGLRLAVDVTPDRSMTAIAAAGICGDEVRQVEVAKHRAGTSWAVDELVRMATEHEAVEILLDPGSPAGGLVKPLEERGIEPRLVTTRELGQACAELMDMVKDGGDLRHLADPRLDRAVAGATRRNLGDGSFAWSRRDSTVDISPLVAATLALHGVIDDDYDVLESVWGG